MKVNRSLVPIKLHYFLRYAGSSFLIMVLPLIARQKGISAQGIGFLWTLMPIVGLISNSVSGTLADYFRAHKSVCLISISFLTAGLVATYGLPCLPTEEEALHNTLREVKSLSEALDEPPRNFTAQGSAHQNASFPAFNLTGPGNEKVSAIEEVLTNLIDPEMVVEEGEAFPPNPKVSTGGEPNPSSDTSSLSYLMQFPQFWLIFIALMTEQMGISTCVMITDAVCFQILGTERNKYGKQRLWGTIGMGILCIVSGALVDLYSKGLPQTDYLPAVIICIVIMAADLLLVYKMKIPSTQGSKIKMGDVGHVLTHPQTILFIVTVYVMGTSLGNLWVFKMMHIEDVALNWDPSFQNVKLLQGLDLGIETFGGEVPFFFLAGMIIQRLGHTVVFAGTIGTLALRCCLYYTVSNPWFFLPIEFLNGISYGLFHACMASYASYLAPPGAQATLQAIVKGAFSTGLATAGFLGGTLYHTAGGAVMFLSIGVFDGCFCVLFVLLQFLITRYYSNTKSLGNSGYVPPSSSTTPSSQESLENSRSDDTEEEKGEGERDTTKSLMEDV